MRSLKQPASSLLGGGPSEYEDEWNVKCMVFDQKYLPYLPPSLPPITLGIVFRSRIMGGISYTVLLAEVVQGKTSEN